MIKIAIIVLASLLYLSIGYGIFDLGLRSLGGKDNYMECIKESNPKHYNAAFRVAVVLVVIFWPYYLIKTLIRGDK